MSGSERERAGIPEVSELVGDFAERYEPPERLVERYARMAREARRERRFQKVTVWRAGLAGALAATVALLLGQVVLDRLTDTGDPYQIVAKNGRSIYLNALRRTKKTSPRSVSFKKLFAAVHERTGYIPKLAFRGKETYVLESGSIRELQGHEVVTLTYRGDDSRLLLMVMRTEGAPEDLAALREGWAAVNQGSPRAFLWQRGDLLFALVGEGPIEQFQSLSTRLSPPPAKKI